MESSYKMIGKEVRVTIDRPLGSLHPKFSHIRYSVNYGYIEGLAGGDGAWQDVYVLGVDVPIKEFFGVIVAVIHRVNDVEDKLVVVPQGYHVTKEEIAQKVSFVEQFFETEIIM